MASDQDEIDQIMNEIEELQHEMNAKAEPATAGPTAQEDDRSLNEFVTVEESVVADASGAEPVEELTAESSVAETSSTENSSGESTSDEPWVEETIAELHRNDSVERHASGPAVSGRVTLGVTPGVGVCLKQESSGQELVIEFESDCVRITTSDGAELKLPVLSRSQGLRRVA